MRLLYGHKCLRCEKDACWVFLLGHVSQWPDRDRNVARHTKYKSLKESSRHNDSRSCSRGMKCSENSSTPTSPSTPASSKILLHTNVRLGTQITENSCSMLPFFCNRLICSDSKRLSASNDSVTPSASAGERYRASWFRNGLILGSRLIAKSMRKSR